MEPLLHGNDTLNHVDQMIAIARGSPEKILNFPSESYVILSELFRILDFKRNLPFSKLARILRKWGSLAPTIEWEGQCYYSAPHYCYRVKNTWASLPEKKHQRLTLSISLSIFTVFLLGKIRANHCSCLAWSLGSLFPLNYMWGWL